MHCLIHSPTSPPPAQRSSLTPAAATLSKPGQALSAPFFRPSDNTTIFQLFIPANMIFTRYLAFCPLIMQPLNPALAAEMSTLASSLRTAAETYGVVTDPVHGQIYAYEIDGYGSRNIIDDVNIPSFPRQFSATSTRQARCTKTPSP